MVTNEHPRECVLWNLRGRCS